MTASAAFKCNIQMNRVEALKPYQAVSIQAITYETKYEQRAKGGDFIFYQTFKLPSFVETNLRIGLQIQLLNFQGHDPKCLSKRFFPTQLTH